MSDALQELLDKQAITEVIYRYSRGVPRLVNAICDKALLAGYVSGTDYLTAKHVRRARHELEGRTR